MKKALSLILALVMCLSLCACGGGENGLNNNTGPDYSKAIRKVDFSMTMDDVRSMETSTLIEVRDNILTYKGTVGGYSGELIYNFYKETGTLHFVKFFFNNEPDFTSYIEAFKDEYGKAEKEKNGFEFWYGMTEGVEMYFSSEYTTISGGCNISISRTNAPVAGEYEPAETQGSSPNWSADYRDTMSEDEIEDLLVRTALDEAIWRLEGKDYDLDASKYKIGSIRTVDKYGVYNYEVSGTLYLYDKYGSLKDIATFTCSTIYIDEDGKAISTGTTTINFD